MRRATLLSIILAGGAALPGCAQIGSAADAAWSGTKSAARFVSRPFRGELRDAPEPTYQFANDADTLPDTVSYASGRAPHARSAEAFAPTGASASRPAPYSTGNYYGTASDVSAVATVAAPTELSYVRLNGQSSMQDWRNCEVMHRGYWLVDAAGGRINPDFEVCMRNKGYVRESELAAYGFRGETPVSGGASLGYASAY